MGGGRSCTALEPVRALQLVVLAFTFLTLVMNGFDIKTIALAAPALTAAWGIIFFFIAGMLALTFISVVAFCRHIPATQRGAPKWTTRGWLRPLYSR